MLAARNRDHGEIARRLAACASLAAAAFPMMSLFYERFMSRLEDEIAAAPNPARVAEAALQETGQPQPVVRCRNAAASVPSSR